jgi:hypothetical protein
MNFCGASMLGLVAIHLLVGALLGFCVTVFIVIPIAAIALIEAFLVIDPDPVRLEVGAVASIATDINRHPDLAVPPEVTYVRKGNGAPKFGP